MGRKKPEPKDTLRKKFRRYIGSLIFTTGLAGLAITGGAKAVDREVDDLPFYTRWPAKAYIAMLDEGDFFNYKNILDHSDEFFLASTFLSCAGASYYCCGRRNYQSL